MYLQEPPRGDGASSSVNFLLLLTNMQKSESWGVEESTTSFRDDAFEATLLTIHNGETRNKETNK